MSPRPRDRSLAVLMQAGRAAALHYVEGLSNVEIAERLGVSRFRVARLLEVARDEGIIRFTVTMPFDADAELSDQLRERYGLRHGIVVRHSPHADVLRERLGEAAAALLASVLTEDDVLGVAWGRTLSAMARHVVDLPPCPVVQLTGVAGDPQQNSAELIREISQTSGGRAYPLYAPMVVPDRATLRGLRRHETIARVLEQQAAVTVAVVAVGSWQPPDSQLLQSLPGPAGARLTRGGVRAEICGTLLDAQGQEVRGLVNNLLAVETSVLRAIPETIAVAGGPSKIGALRSALASGLVSSLVTDENSARELTEG